MANVIQIKRSSTNATPPSLEAGELAYSSLSTSQKLFIGNPDTGAGGSLVIGGKKYVDRVDHTPGQLIGKVDGAAILVDADSLLDKIYIGESNTSYLRIAKTASGNAIIDTVSSGNLEIKPNGNLKLDPQTGNFDFTARSYVWDLYPTGAAALNIKSNNVSLIKFDTQSTSTSKVIIGDGGDVPLYLGTSSAGFEMPKSAGTNGQVLSMVISGSNRTATWTNVSGSLGFRDNASPSTGSSTISLASQVLEFRGSTAITTAVTDQHVEISATDATTSAKGIASFNSAHFTVSSGAVSANNITLGTSGLTLGSTTSTVAGLTSLTAGNLTTSANTISGTGVITLTPGTNETVTVPAGYKDRSNFSTNSLATKEYVDSFMQGLEIKDSVRVATTTNLTSIAGSLTIDTVAVQTGDRVLVKDQTTQTNNGIYVVDTGGSWTRATDADSAADLNKGVFVWIEEGSVNASQGYVVTAGTFGGSGSEGNIVWTQFSGAGQIVAGTGLTKNANTLNVVADDVTLAVAADSIALKGGITTTAAGDILYGIAGDGGYNRLQKPTSTGQTVSSFLLSMNTSGVPSWGDTIDGGTWT